jgi:hypothetical protein
VASRRRRTESDFPGGGPAATRWDINPPVRKRVEVAGGVFSDEDGDGYKTYEEASTLKDVNYISCGAQRSELSFTPNKALTNAAGKLAREVSLVQTTNSNIIDEQNCSVRAVRSVLASDTRLALPLFEALPTEILGAEAFVSGRFRESIAYFERARAHYSAHHLHQTEARRPLQAACPALRHTG